MEKYKEENDRKKAFLKSYRQQKIREETIEEQMEVLAEHKKNASHRTDDGMPHTRNHTDLSDYITKLETLEEELGDVQNQMIKAAIDVITAIKGLESQDEQNVLTKRYISGWSWERIAEELGYTKRNVYYIHGKALRNIQAPKRKEPDSPAL